MLDLIGCVLTCAGTHGRSRQQTTASSDGGTEPRIVGDSTDSRAQSRADQRADTGPLRRRQAAGAFRSRAGLLRGPLPAHQVVALESVERLAGAGQSHDARTRGHRRTGPEEQATQHRKGNNSSGCGHGRSASVACDGAGWTGVAAAPTQPSTGPRPSQCTTAVNGPKEAAMNAVWLPSADSSIAPVTILDREGRVVRVLSAAEFRRHHAAPVPAPSGAAPRHPRPRRDERPRGLDSES